MMNKGLEVIEAACLFALAPEEIDVLVHPQSIIHGMVESRIDPWLPNWARQTVRTPIAHCLGWPDRIVGPAAKLDLAKIGQLTFAPPRVFHGGSPRSLTPSTSNASPRSVESRTAKEGERPVSRIPRVGGDHDETRSKLTLAGGGEHCSYTTRPGTNYSSSGKRLRAAVWVSNRLPKIKIV